MINQRIHQSSSWNPPTQQKSSQLTSPSLTIQTQNSPKSSQEDKEKEAFGQDRYEADRLQLKEKIGTLTSAEQEQLGVLQAKMNDFWVRGRERASQFGHNLANIPVSSPHKQGSALQPKVAIQAKLTIGEPGDKYEREADSVAAEVVNQINSPQVQQQGQAVQRQEELEEEELQTKPEITSLQRMEEPEEEELQTKPSISNLQRSPLSIQLVAEYDHMVIDKSDVGLDALRNSLNANGLQTAQNRNIRLSEGSEKLGHHQHVFMWDKSKKGIEGSVGIEERGGTVRIKIRKNSLTEPKWYSQGNLKGDNMGPLGGTSTTGAWAYEGDIERKYLFIEGLDQVNQPGFDNWYKGDGWPEA